MRRCTWRDCVEHGTRWLRFGRRPDGKPLRGLWYCDDHADEAHTVFHVDHDSGREAPVTQEDQFDASGSSTSSEEPKEEALFDRTELVAA